MTWFRIARLGRAAKRGFRQASLPLMIAVSAISATPALAGYVDTDFFEQQALDHQAALLSGVVEGLPNYTTMQAIPSLALDESRGFYAQAFTDGSAVTIAFRGTRPGNVSVFKDAFADTSFATGVPSVALLLYVAEAAAFVRTVHDAYPHTQITLTGHSLGGAIADIVGTATGYRTRSYDAPGTVGVQPFLAPLLAGISGISGNGTTDAIDYRLVGDQVSLVGDHSGRVVSVYPFRPVPNIAVGPPGFAASVDGPVDDTLQAISDAVDAHDIGTLAFGINRYGSKVPGFAGPVLANREILRGTAAALGFAVLYFGGDVEPFVLLHFDPLRAGAYSFVESGSSPFLHALTLPSYDGVSGFAISTFADSRWSDLGYASPSQPFLFADDAIGFRLEALDPNGAAVGFPDDLLFDLSFGSAGHFAATLESLPLAQSSVPEPGAWLIWILGLGCVGLVSRSRARTNVV